MDFILCNSCKYITQPVKKGIGYYNSNQDRMYCSYCDNIINILSDECTKLCGIAINQDKEDELFKKERTQYRIDSESIVDQIKLSFNHDISQNYKCTICTKLIDFKANLKCTYCSKIFCFYCFMDKCKANSRKCPSCLHEITGTSLCVDRTLITEFKKLSNIFIAKKSRKIECRYHHKDCEMFCKTCNCEVCCTCIVNTKHIKHELCLMDEQRDFIISLVKKVRNSKESVVSLKNTELERISQNYLLTEFLHNNIIRSYQNKISEIQNEIKNNISVLYMSCNEKLKCDLEDYNKSEKLLSEFELKTDINQMMQITNTIEFLEEGKNKIIKEIKEIKQSEIEPKLITSEIPKSFEFFIEGSQISISSELGIEVELTDSQSSSSYIKLIKLENSKIHMYFTEEEPCDYYAKIQLENNLLCKLYDNNKIIKIRSDSKEYCIGEYELDKNQMVPKLQFSIMLWKETDTIRKFIDDTNTVFKTQITEFMNSI